MKATTDYESEACRLARRLLAAVHNGRVRDVRSLLAQGANPNWPSASGFRWSFLNGSVVVPPLFPLTMVGTITKRANRKPILDLLLGGGGSLGLALVWLSVGPMLEVRIRSGLALCELLLGSCHASAQRSVAKAWLRHASSLLNQLEPKAPYSRDYLLDLHRRLKAICPSYGEQHVPAPWATAELL